MPAAAKAQSTPAPQQTQAGESISADLIVDGSGCADRSGLEAAVRLRSQRIVFEAHVSRRVLVQVSEPKARDPWQATIRFELIDQAPQTRRIEADECRELVNAAGFVIALTLDPPTWEAPPNESPPPETSSASPPPAQQEPSRQAETPSAPPSGPADPGQKKSPRDDPSEVRDVLGAHVAVAHAIAPEVLLGGGLSFSRFWLASDSPHWEPSFRLSAQYVAGAGFVATGGEAAFELATASVELCPTVLGRQDFGVRPCALFTFGAVRASGSRTTRPEAHTRPWAVIGGALVAHALVDSWLVVELAGGLGATLVYDSFQFKPQVFHDVGPLAASGAFGLGVVLP